MTPDCRCGHNRMSHEVEASPSCVHEGCGCTGYRPAAAGPVPPSSSSGTTPRLGIEQLIASGKRSSTRRTVALAERIEELVKDLAARLREDGAKAQAREDVARLRRQLALAEAKAARGADAELLHCPGCPDEFGTAQALGAHRARAHGYRKDSS